jgi:nucleoid DNA-binding protein
LAIDPDMIANDLADVLYAYFIQRQSLSLPGIGTFDMHRISAQTDFANKKMLPPGYAIGFNLHEDAPDRDLFEYIARRKQVEEWEAIRAVHDFALELKSRVQQGEPFTWEGIGSLRPGVGKDIIFEPESLQYAFIPHVGAQRIIRQNATHAVIVGDREHTREEMSDMLAADAPEFRVKPGWWNFAAILAAAAVLLIAIRAFSGGVSPFSGRQHQLHPAMPPSTHATLVEP